MAAEEFTDRMRERMPAHRVWHQNVAAPSLSRPANDALWDDMRSRLRIYEQQRRAEASALTWRTAYDLMKRSMAAGSLVAVFVAAGLLVVALLGLR